MTADSMFSNGLWVLLSTRLVNSAIFKPCNDSGWKEIKMETGKIPEQ